jgi:hypothetical protein
MADNIDAFRAVGGDRLDRGVLRERPAQVDQLPVDAL